MESILQDIRFFARFIVKNPGFTFAALLALSLGIGANTAIYSVIRAVMLSPLPYAEPERLVVLSETNKAKGIEQTTIADANLLDWQGQSHVFEGVAPFVFWNPIIKTNEGVERIQGAMFSPELLTVLQVKPHLGGTFPLTHDQDSGSPVLLSYNYWQQQFGGTPDVVGKTLTLDDTSYTVIGVMPRNFRFPDPLHNWKPDLWSPLLLDVDRVTRKARYLNAVARLRPGVTLEQARAEMDSITGKLEQEYPETNAGWGVNVIPLREQIVGDLRKPLLVIYGAVCFVLLIATANVASLLLARAQTRQKEIALRVALGAKRSRLIQQFLTESVLLSLTGGLLGLLMAVWGRDLLLSMAPENLPQVKEIETDVNLLIFTLAISVLTGLIFGLAPALQATKPDFQNALKETGSNASVGVRARRLLKLIASAETALALVLLIGAGLMARSFIRLQEVDLGFDPGGILTAEIRLPNSKYLEPHRRLSFFEELLRNIEARKVSSVGLSTQLPVGKGMSLDFNIEGGSTSSEDETQNADFTAVSPNYFQTLSVPLQRGRQFTERDNKGAPRVVIINKEMARRFWPGEEPIGKQLTIQFHGKTPYEIVGVVEDTRTQGPDSLSRPQMFVPHLQEPTTRMFIAVHTDGEPTDFASTLRSISRSIDREVLVENVAAMDKLLTDTISRPRFNMTLVSIFGVIALVLAVIGIYSTMSFSVAQQTHEIGIRMALGAQRRDVLLLVLRQGAAPILLGVIIGLFAAVAMNRILSSLLFGISATDPSTFIGIALLLILVSLIAIYIPARRATRIDPVLAIRNE